MTDSECGISTPLRTSASMSPMAHRSLNVKTAVAGGVNCSNSWCGPSASGFGVTAVEDSNVVGQVVSVHGLFVGPAPQGRHLSLSTVEVADLTVTKAGQVCHGLAEALVVVGPHHIDSGR